MTQLMLLVLIGYLYPTDFNYKFHWLVCDWNHN